MIDYEEKAQELAKKLEWFTDRPITSVDIETIAFALLQEYHQGREDNNMLWKETLKDVCDTFKKVP